MSEEKWDTNSYLLTDDEIEFYLKGDRRDIDRLMLKSINRLTSHIVPHVQTENKLVAEWESIRSRLGGMRQIEARAKYVDALLEKSKARTAAWSKIADSSVLWALLILLAFVGKAVLEAGIEAIKQRLPG